MKTLKQTVRNKRLETVSRPKRYLQTGTSLNLSLHLLNLSLSQLVFGEIETLSFLGMIVARLVWLSFIRTLSDSEAVKDRIS